MYWRVWSMADKFSQIVTGTDKSKEAKQSEKERKDAILRYHAYNMPSDRTDNIDFDKMQNWTQGWWQRPAFVSYLDQLNLNVADLQVLGDKAAAYLNTKYGPGSAFKTSKGSWSYKPNVKEDAAAKMIYAIYEYNSKMPFGSAFENRSAMAQTQQKQEKAAKTVQAADQKRSGELMGMSFNDMVNNVTGQEAAKMLIDIANQMKPLPDNDAYGLQLNDKLNKYRQAFFNKGAGKNANWKWMNDFITAYISMKPYYEDQNFLNTWRGIVDRNFNKNATTGQLALNIRSGDVTGGQNGSKDK